jgi:cyanophycinase-like exopeptidase
MGGGPEDDTAARRFVDGASGGDVVILRASGSLTSYPDYFGGAALGADPAPNSVETVRTSSPFAAGQPAVLCRLADAEAVWLAGGDQSDYLEGWPRSVHRALVEAGARGVAVGGTSAGAVSLGEAAFDASRGTVTSDRALADPLAPEVSLSYPEFALPELEGVYVDSHFTERDREGRLLVFLARFLAEKDRPAVVGVGLDEGMALVVEGGRFAVHGPPGGRVWIYRAEGPATLEPATPLELFGIRRVGLAEGEEGPWPLSFDAYTFRRLVVEEGVVGEP